MKLSTSHIGLMAGILLFSIYGRAEPTNFEISGSARVRSESHSNSDFNDSTADYTNFTGSRFRVDMKFKPNEKVNVFLEPQFSKSWGEPEVVPTSASANTVTNSSGATNDTGMDVHQAYLSYLVDDSFSVTIGRKEFNYGDQLLVGGVGWSNVGRAFDVGLGSYKYSIGNVELFSAKVKDTNATGAGPGDRNLSGVYSTNRFGDFMQNVDAYGFVSEDHSGVIPTSTNAYGIRLRSPISDFDYRFEGTLEKVTSTTQSTGANQWDAEVGYVLISEKKLRISGEYFRASENYDQLYPTGHKWLGYADLFSRRNIKGFRVGVSSQLFDGFSLSFDYHDFKRAETGAPAYKFSGAGYGSVGTEENVATEMDLVASYKVAGDVTLEAGAARSEPKEYLKANGGADQASFYYLQVATSF